MKACSLTSSYCSAGSFGRGPALANLVCRRFGLLPSGRGAAHVLVLAPILVTIKQSSIPFARHTSSYPEAGVPLQAGPRSGRGVPGAIHRPSTVGQGGRLALRRCRDSGGRVSPFHGRVTPTTRTKPTPSATSPFPAGDRESAGILHSANGIPARPPTHPKP